MNSILFKYTPSADEIPLPPAAEIAVTDLAVRGRRIDDRSVLADNADMTVNNDDISGLQTAVVRDLLIFADRTPAL